MRNILALLDVYYSYQLFGQKSPKLIFCDIADPALISCTLYNLGLSLKASHGIIVRLLQIPEFLKLVFAKPDEIGHDDHYQKFQRRINEIVGDRPVLDERRKIFYEQIITEGHRGRHQWNLFISCIWEWCIDPRHAFAGLGRIFVRSLSYQY